MCYLVEINSQGKPIKVKAIDQDQFGKYAVAINQIVEFNGSFYSLATKLGRSQYKIAKWSIQD